MLETLTRTGQPTRAEITDARRRPARRCVLPNRGPHSALALETLADILVRGDVVQRRSLTLKRHIHSGDTRRPSRS